MGCLIELLENAYFHCLHYVVNKRLRKLERLFWALWVILAIVGAIFLVTISVDTFYSTKASIRVRTDYLDFTAPFPAIFFCEEKEIKGKFEEMLKHMEFNLTDRQSALDIENFVRAASFIRPLDRAMPQRICDNPQKDYCRFITAYGQDLSLIAKHVQIRASCKEIFTSCIFNGVEFDCCERFLPVGTYEGKCFAVNSYNAFIENYLLNDSVEAQYGSLREGQKIQALRHDPANNPANLSVEFAHTDLSVWYMGNTNIPTKMYQKQNHLHERRFREFRTADIYLRVLVASPDNSLLKLEIKQRNCRLSQETQSLRSFKVYSNSACEVECIKQAQLELCGCYTHLFPNQNDFPNKQCNISGLNCVSQALEIRRYLDKCPCISNCLLVDVSLIGIVPNFAYDSNTRLRSNKSKKRVNFITRAPTVQYVRHANQKFLDFIVSIGGAISLFIGCSCLTVAQIVYYFLVKPLVERHHPND